MVVPAAASKPEQCRLHRVMGEVRELHPDSLSQLGRMLPCRTFLFPNAAVSRGVYLKQAAEYRFASTGTPNVPACQKEAREKGRQWVVWEAEVWVCWGAFSRLQRGRVSCLAVNKPRFWGGKVPGRQIHCSLFQQQQQLASGANEGFHKQP